MGLGSDPFSKARISVSPSKDIINDRRIAPYPGFQLWRNDNGSASAAPAIRLKPFLNFAFYRITHLLLSSTALMVEQDHGVLKCMELQTEKIVRPGTAACIALDVPFHIKGNRSNPQCGGSREEAPDRGFHIRVGHQDDEVLYLIFHSSTPPAKRTEKLGSPCHSCKLGWRSPDTISVAPSEALAKQSTLSESFGLIRLSRTGECVARRT